MTERARQETCEERVERHMVSRLDEIRTMFTSDDEDERERWYDYGLSFDYVPAGTYTDQGQGWFRYLISWAGPSEEIRFYVDAGLTMYRAEFWLLDWFDGASRPLDKDDAEMIWDVLTAGDDPEIIRFLIDKATD